MFKHVYFYITIFAIAIFGIVLNSTYDQQFTYAGSGTEGDPYTVCAAGCDYTSLNSAVNAVAEGSFIEIQETYNSSTDSFGMTFGADNLTISCVNTRISIGPTSTVGNPSISLSASSTIKGCTIDGSNSTWGAGLGGEAPNYFYDNIFIDYNFTLATGTIFASNTVYRNAASSSIFEINNPDITITSNTINYEYTGPAPADIAYGVFQIGSSDLANDLTISSNTISVASSSVEISVTQMFSIGTNFDFRGNKISYEGDADTPMYMYARNTATSTLSMTHNTFFISNYLGGTDQRSFLVIEDDTTNDIGPLFATATHNIFYYDGSGTTTLARAFKFKTDVPTSILYEDYNGFAGQMENPAIGVDGDEEVPITSGGNSKYAVGSSPIRDKNVSVLDDFQLNPFTSFLDVDGTVDMGAEPGVRGSSFNIDDDGTIDYSSVHGTSTADIARNVRSGDTWTIAAGSYLPFALASSSLATSSVTIDGAGASTIINGTSAYTYGVSVTGFSGITIQDLYIQNASSTVTEYTSTVGVFDFGGNTYDKSSAAGGSNGQVVYLEACTGGGTSFITEDGADITSYEGISTSDIHLVLVDIGGNKFTSYVSDSVASSAAEVNALDSCGGVTIVKFVTSTFAVSDGVYTYDSSAVAAESITLTTGYTSPPSITRTQTQSAGVKLSSASSATITNVTSTGNTYGLHLAGSTSGTSFNSSTISNSTLYDVYSDSTSDNDLKNSIFTVASSSVTGDGNVDVYYRSRALVTTTASAVAGADVSFTRGDSGAVAYATSSASGYTPWTDFLLAFSMTSSSIATDNGGYNPWTVAALATSTYSASSTTATYNSANQLVTLLLSTAPSVPTAPSAMTSSSVTATAITTAWTDNSADETSFLFDYISGSDVSDFPGTTSSLAANTVSNSISSLTPNTQYTFRVAAVGSGGTSTYATSSVFYTSSTAPGTPSGTATGQTTMTVSWSANSNGTGTVYELYNVTDSSVVATTTAVTYAVTGLTANTAYQFKVRAQDLGDSSTYSSYSSDSTAATTDAVPVVSSPSGGGSIPIAPSQPKFLEGVDAMNGALKINNGAATTDATNVTLNFNVTNVSQVAISENIDFAGVSFVPYLPELPYTLSEGNGNKTVYVKLRSEFGGTLTVTDDIMLVSQTTDAPNTEGECPLARQHAYTTAGESGIYYVTSECTKRPFKKSVTYFTYFTSYDNAQLTTKSILNSVPDDTLGFMPLGPLYNPASGALIKLPNDPKVYLLLGETIYHIANEDAAIFQFGEQWVSWIDTVDARVADTYTISTTILDDTTRPDGILIKYPNNAKVYQLDTPNEAQVKRHVKDEATFTSLQFRWDRIVTIPTTETYSDGSSI